MYQDLEKNNNLRNEIMSWIGIFIISLSIIFFSNTFIYNKYVISGISMEPTFKDKDQVIINLLPKYFNNFDRGNVVILHANNKEDYIKRIVGLPGEHVKVINNQLFINNVKYTEPYLDKNIITSDFDSTLLNNTEGEDTIPKDKYLVLGDNRENSADSRNVLGLVDKDQLVGTVVLRYSHPFRFNFTEKVEKQK